MPENLSLPEVPRPEYPRPQFVRPEWMNLNGTWEFAFDDANEGLTREWSNGASLPQRIQVPFAYQSALSGINDQSIHEIVWYARDFEVPLHWKGQDILLHFGAVDYRCIVWVNGKEVGHNQGGHVPFWFNIAPYLVEGVNRIVLRVEDSQNKQQPRGKQSVSGIPKGIDYYCTTGIWQTVWLEPVPSLRIQELNISSDADAGELELRVFLHAPSMGWELHVEVEDNGEVVARAEESTASSTARLTIPIPDAKLWSSDSPHLYDIRVKMLRDGEVVDAVETYAGIRSISLKNQQFVLNNEPTYLAMVLDQGYWPDGNYTAPSDEALRADVEWTKKFGFNAARKHQKVEDPRYLYWCDKLGVLVWGEMANARGWSPAAEEMLLSEWERVVRRDLNHPCIVTWVPINESMGAPDLRKGHAGQYSFIERIVTLTRRLDPNRPVIDNDGWEHTDVTDIYALHDYTPTAERLRKRYAQTLAGGPLPSISGGESPEGEPWGAPLLAGKAQYHGQPVVLSEVGGFMMIPAQSEGQKLDILYELYGTCTTEDELLERYANLMEGLGELFFICGFCYTQLSDIEQEANGLLTYDRKPKVDPARIAALHAPFFNRARSLTD